MRKDTAQPASGTASSVSSPRVSSTNRHRRRFLFALSAGGAGVAAATVAAAPAVTTALPAGPEADSEAAGYRETEHVRHYYRTARL